MLNCLGVLRIIILRDMMRRGKPKRRKSFSFLIPMNRIFSRLLDAGMPVVVVNLSR